MNYYQARELRTIDNGEPMGLYHFTCQRDGHVWAVGYCAENHCIDHDTPQKAEECYRQYLIDKASYDRGRYLTPVPCSHHNCKNTTEAYAMIGNGTIIPLCDEHRNRDGLLATVERPEQIISSY